jgi:hypothetical protein
MNVSGKFLWFVINLAKFMPKHDWGPTPNATKENNVIGSYRIITTQRKLKSM